MTKETSKEPPNKEKTPAVATTRKTGGAGFDFEDQGNAWLMVKMLRGTHMPGINSAGIGLQMQTGALGWDKIDDALIQCQEQNSELRQLAISYKSNVQVTASGLPSDFVTAAWSLWKKDKPFRLGHDCLMLATRGSDKKFLPIWNDLKDWCVDQDTPSALAKINASQTHKKVYDSIKTPANDVEISDEDVVNLIWHLEVTPLDFQLAHSEIHKHALAYCRELLFSGSEDEAKKLWKTLVSKAAEKRMVGGTIRLPELLEELSREFNLKDHPDFSSSWNALANITEDYKASIETTMPTGFKVPRNAVTEDLIETLSSAEPVTVLYGASGNGKSAVVKSVLDEDFSDWNQVWLGPDELGIALSETKRTDFGLSHPMHKILASTVQQQNLLVIDSAERIKPECEKKPKN